MSTVYAGRAGRRQRRVLLAAPDSDVVDEQVRPVTVSIMSRGAPGGGDAEEVSPRVRILHPQEPGSPAGLVTENPKASSSSSAPRHRRPPPPPREVWLQEPGQGDLVSCISRESSAVPSLLGAPEDAEKEAEAVRLMAENGDTWSAQVYGDPPTPDQYRERTREEFRAEVVDPLERSLLEASFEVLPEEEAAVVLGSPPQHGGESVSAPRLFGSGRSIPLFQQRASPRGVDDDDVAGWDQEVQSPSPKRKGGGRARRTGGAPSHHHGQRRDRDIRESASGLDTSAEEWYLGKYHIPGGPPRAVLQVPPARIDMDEVEREDDVVYAHPRYTKGGFDGHGFLSRPAEAYVVERMETTVDDMSSSRRFRAAQQEFSGAPTSQLKVASVGTETRSQGVRDSPRRGASHAMSVSSLGPSSFSFVEDTDPVAFQHVVQNVHDSFVNEDGEPLNERQRDQLFLQSCEGILEHLRRQERNLLARKRTEEFQENRGPMPNWWELKDKRFSEEVQRNNRSLNQSWEEVEEYLDELMRPVAP